MQSKPIFDLSPIAMSLSTPESGKLSDVNVAWLNLFEFSDKDLVIGKTPLELNLFPQMKEFEHESETLKDSESRQIQAEAITFTGKRIFVQVTIRIVNLNNDSYLFSIIEEITMRRMAEIAHTESEKRFRSILNNSQDVIYCYNLRSREFEYVSPSVKSVLGFTPDELLHNWKDLISVIHPEYTHDFNKALRKCVKEGRARVEYLQTNRGGDFRWILNTMSISRQHQGDPLLLFGNITDITDLKRTEEALKESEAKYRQIVETANEGIWQTDADMKTIYVNEKMAEMMGYTAGEMTGSHFFDFMDEEGIALMNKKLQNGKNSKRTYGHKFIKKDGEYLHVLVNATPLHDEKGRYNGSICMLTDISERINVERALRKTRKKLEIALENGNIGTWEWNLKTKEVTWDERTSKMFGINKGFSGSIQIFENLIHEDDLAFLKSSYYKALQSNLPLDAIFRTRTINGESDFISIKGVIGHDRKGKPASMSGVCFDVTEMKKGAEQNLIKLNEELLRSNNDLKQFAYVASHDLQEPLRMVSSFTQLLQQRYKDKLDEDGNEYIRFAVDGSKRMYDLLNGLLAYSRVQTKGKEFVKVDMNEIVEKVKANLNLVIKEREAVITVKKLPVIFADESQMMQLMQNLIENGIKFSQSKPAITISETLNSGFQVFSVRDHGIGIETQYFEKIFKIFQRLHRNDEYRGTGIGLAICKRIVERHSGTIWLTSEYGKGSNFFFTIPFVDSDNSESKGSDQ
jgi:PAS domain S-box-containing protein